MAVPIVALAVSAGASILSGISQMSAANYQAKVAANNATIARQNAAYSASAGAARTEQAGLQARDQAGLVRAAIGANNIDTNSGSASDVQVSQRELGYLDTATVANNAALQVYGYKSQATSYQAQSQLESAEAPQALIGGIGAAAGTVASNASLLSSGPTVPPEYQWMVPGNSAGADASIDNIG